VLAAAQAQIAVVVDHSEIAGVQPAVGGRTAEVIGGGEDFAHPRVVGLVDPQTKTIDRPPD
jgi:hypothetical protein